MGRTAAYTFKGALIGAIGAVILFSIGFFIEVFNLGCAILTCDCDKSTVFDWSGMWGVLGLCIIAGAVIGLFYGIYKAKEEKNAQMAKINAANSEQARKQRIQWAGEIKQEALKANNKCYDIKKQTQPIVITTYKASEKMMEIMNELSKIAEMQGKVDLLGEELSKKGGSSL